MEPCEHLIDERELLALDDVLARSPLALVAFDPKFRISYWSERAVRMFGYSAQEMLGKRPDETPIVPPGDRMLVASVAERLQAENGNALTLLARMVCADGTTIVCRWSSVAVQQHPRFSAVTIAEDLSEEAKSRRDLVESEGRFRALFETNPLPIVIIDNNGVLADMNAAVSNFGARPQRDSVIGHDFREWILPEDLPKHEEYLRRALSGESLSYRTRARSVTGEPLELSITSVPITREGEIGGVFCIIHDETEEHATQRRLLNQERALEESEARLRSLFEHNPDPVLALDLAGTIIDCNEAASRVSGLTRENIVGTRYDSFLPQTLRPQVRAAFDRAGAGRPTTVAFEILNAEGRRIEVDGTIIPQYLHGAIAGIYAIFQDTTERKSAERRAEMQRRRMRDLYYLATSGMRDDERVGASLEMGARAFGRSTAAVVEALRGSQPRLLEVYRGPSGDGPSDDELLALGRAAAAGAVAGVPMLSPGGVATRLDVAGDLFGAIVFSGEGEYDFTETDADLLGLVATLIGGAIENERARTRLRRLAYFDTLTGLPNRAMLAERVRDAIEVAQSRLSRFALFFLDLDGFKDINDTLGHTRGDQLLLATALRLSQALGKRGTVARMGSDEFVVLLTECEDTDEASGVAKQIVELIGEPFTLDDSEQYVSASIGIAMYPEDGRDDQTLVKNADIAMSRAKDGGRNRYFFYNPTLEAPIHMRLSQEKLLRRALELEEFVVYYQPQLDLRTQRIVSVEALVRWQHPKSGLIEPRHFIPSAEISGLIVPLGEWILRTALNQLAIWHRHLSPLRLAVNLSARQFHDRELRERILGALADSGIPHNYLELEITESVAMADAAHSAEILHDLGQGGIRMAVDDFGTGYSSLAYLRQFELDVLKVDASFVRGIGRTPGDEALINTIVGMGHSLDLEVVAEGVETLEQLAFLTAKGCDVVQGFVIAPAMDCAGLERFVIARNEAVSYG